VLTEICTDTVLTLASDPLVLADSAAPAVFAQASLLLVLGEAAAAPTAAPPPDIFLFILMLNTPTALSRRRPVLIVQSACVQLKPAPSDQALRQKCRTLLLLGDLQARAKYHNQLKRLQEGDFRPQHRAGLEERLANGWNEAA